MANSMPKYCERSLWLLGFVLSLSVPKVRSAFAPGIQNFKLNRADEAYSLELYLQSNPSLGVCNGDKAFLEGVPDLVCKPLYCLWSDKHRLNVDVNERPFNPNANACEDPVGGQRPLRDDITPQVSFILPFYNNAMEAAQSLLELFRTAREVDSAEYIIVNDGSDYDEQMNRTLYYLDYFLGISAHYHVNPAHSGFGGAVNKGVELAKGEYLVVVDSNALVGPGWLAAIMKTFKDDPKAGLVGPLLLDAEHRVQEAGGWVLKDGSGGSYGSGKALSPDVTYLREVDFVAGAVFAVGRSVLEHYGLFNDEYLDASYKDTDVSFRALAKGLKVYFQPLAVVYHPYGTPFKALHDIFVDQAAGENNRQFRITYQKLLQERHCERGVSDEKAARWRTGPNILWIDLKIPLVGRDSSSVRLVNLLRMLVKARFDVTFRAVQADPSEDVGAAQLRFFGINVIEGDNPHMWQLKDSQGYCPYHAIFISHKKTFDLVYRHIKQDCPCTPIVYDTVALSFLREARAILHGNFTGWNFDPLWPENTLAWLKSGKMKETVAWESLRQELLFTSKSSLTVVTSSVEQKLLRKIIPKAKVKVLSNVLDVPQDEPAPPGNCIHRRGAIFFGNFDSAVNTQSVETFITDVMPLLLKKLDTQGADLADNFVFEIVGYGELPLDIKALVEQHESRVKYYGMVEQWRLEQRMNDSKVFVSALLSGSGVKGNVNMAMKLGLPVVGTPMTFESTEAVDGVDCRLAVTPEEFAQKVFEVYVRCDMWETLSKGGLLNVRKHFSLDTAQKDLFAILADLNIHPQKPDSPPVCTGLI